MVKVAAHFRHQTIVPLSQVEPVKAEVVIRSTLPGEVLAPSAWQRVHSSR
jgi:hypothetical protein